MTKRAIKGGEFGANGEWYEGGKFVNTVAANKKREGSKPSGSEQRAIEHLKRHIAQRRVTQTRVNAVVRRLETAMEIQEMIRDACDWESPEYWEHHDNAMAVARRISALCPPGQGIPLLERLRELVRC